MSEREQRSTEVGENDPDSPERRAIREEREADAAKEAEERGDTPEPAPKPAEPDKES